MKNKRPTKRQMRKEREIVIKCFIVLSVFLAVRSEAPAKAQNEPVSVEAASSTPIVAVVFQDAPKAVYGLPTQSQKDTVAKVCTKAFTDNASKSGCYYDLLAIAYTESRFNCDSVGDSGKAIGCYQIWVNLHKLSVEQAQDFEQAAAWTLNRMISQGYPTYRTWAVGSHNSFTPEVNKRYSAMVKAKSADFERAGL